jgi:hypothetical protein
VALCHVRPSAELAHRIADALGEPLDAIFDERVLDPEKVPTYPGDAQLHPVDRLIAHAVEQGHGRTVTDPATLRKVATVLRRTDATKASAATRTKAG